MDYIQKAIDKARKAREHGAPAAEAREAAAREPSDETGSRARNGLPATINYTQTRTEGASRQAMSDNRVVAGLGEKEAEVYRQLRTQVLQKMRLNNWKTLAVTGPGEAQGKSLTALNLAISLSREVNQTVLLVDLDLRSPTLLGKLGLDTEYGLIDHLEGRADVADILVNPGFERLVIMPGKADQSYNSEILSAPPMQKLLKDITSRYESRLIIFDLPALLVNDDALLFTPFADAVLLVVEDGANSKEDIERCMSLLGDTPLLGTVLNKAD